MTSQVTHRLSEIRDVPADENGRGNTAGFEATCRTCGHQIRSSLRSIVERDIRDHQAWMLQGDILRLRRQARDPMIAISWRRAYGNLALEAERDYYSLTGREAR